MFLAQPDRHAARICSALALALAACSLQMPSESELFGSAGSKSAAHVGASGGSGGDSAGAEALADAGDSATPNATNSAGAAGAKTSSGTGGSGATSGSKAAGGSSGSSGTSGSTAFDPAAGLVSYFMFDEPSGALAANSKDSSKNAKCVGTCTRPTGQLGQAFGLRNDVSPSDWIELPEGIFAGRSAVTLSAWMRDRSASRSGAPLFHFSVGSKETFFFTPDDRNSRTSSSGAHLGGVHGGESFVDLWSTKVDFTDRNWHHVAVAWSADGIELYRDGRSAGSAAKPGVLPSQLGTTSPDYLGRL
ncbi:MAG TPA: LamG-like jellyroll fold domain-containing protein, partial [Polyangiaceae bacterium]|nr:LamG-like jellyroll fold domain-containing protein [Polyangiaceae bacterium]